MRTFEEMFPVLQELGRAMAKYALVDRKPFDFGVGMELFPVEIHLVSTVHALGGAGVTELAEEFGVTKGAVSQQVAKLEKKGLLSKTRDPENRARVIVAVTELGRTASENHIRFHQEHDSRFLEYLGGLDDGDFDAVADLAGWMNRWMDGYLK